MIEAPVTFRFDPHNEAEVKRLATQFVLRMVVRGMVRLRDSMAQQELRLK
jgi:hypothetical protein